MPALVLRAGAIALVAVCGLWALRVLVRARQLRRLYRSAPARHYEVRS